MDEKNKDTLTHRPDQTMDDEKAVEVTAVLSSLP